MLKKGLLLIAASAVSVSAFAGGMDQTPAAQMNDAHAFAGAQVGYVAHYGFDKKSKIVNNATTERSVFTKEQGSFGARVFAGYMFSKYFGLELGAGTFGSQKYAMNTNVSAKNAAYNIRTNALVGFDADLVGNVAVSNDVFVFAKAGMAIVDFRTKGYSSDLSQTEKSVTNWNWMPRAELGLGYNVTKNVALTVSYAHYFGINSAKTIKNGSTTVKKDFNKFGPSFGVAAVGLTYSF